MVGHERTVAACLEFKVDIVKLVTERGVSLAQASRDLGVQVKVLRSWVRELRADPGRAIPGHGTQKPEDAELTRSRREVRGRARRATTNRAFHGCHRNCI